MLIAGLVARRIVCGSIAGQRVDGRRARRHHPLRLARSTSICPPPYVPLVALGQRMIGGETVLADRDAREPPREGYAH